MSINPEKNIKCPYCSEKIKSSAKKCRFCGEWLDKDTYPQTQSFWKSNSKLLSLKNIVIFLIVVFILSQLKSIFLSNNVALTDKQIVNTDQANETALKNVVLEQYQLLQTKNEANLRKLYREYFAPNNYTHKKTEDEYVKYALNYKEDNVDHQEYELHSVKIYGNTGYVDQTTKWCTNPDCSKVTRVNRYNIVYVLYQGKWLMTSEDVMCPRDKRYDLSPEFDRIIDLIIQRTENYNFSISEVPKFRNCLNIQYAKSDSEMNGSEGQFMFVKGQSFDKLDVLVSPRYKIKDDLITAVLLVHELTHANNYIHGLNTGKPLGCFEDEASAFQNQNWFITILNPEERASINARLAVGGSEELVSIKNAWDGNNLAPGLNSEEKSLSFVKSQPAYQQQCANEN